MKWVQKIYSLLTKEEKREQVIILDACALKTKKAMQIIEEASKVVLLYGTIKKELDKEQEDSTELYKKNKCYILKKNREDIESKKYLCVLNYEQYSYVDDNIIEYCKHHKNTTILTCDNGLCSKAKVFHIPYIFPEDEQINKEPISRTRSVAQRQEKQQQNLFETNAKNSSQNETKNEIVAEVESEKQENLNSNPQEEVPQNKENNDYIRLCEEISLSSKGLYIKPIRGCYVNYAVVRENEIIDSKNCNIGDIIYIFRKYNKSELVKIIIYNVVEAEEEMKAEKIKEYDIWCMNDIYMLNLLQELEEKVREFYL